MNPPFLPLRTPRFSLRHCTLLIMGFALRVHADGLAQLDTFLRDTHTFTANFQQTVQGKNKRQESSGYFELQRPGQFRWDYQKPFAQRIVSDGSTLWIFDEDLQQVTQRRIQTALGDTPAALLAGSKELKNAFTLQNGGKQHGLEWVSARAKNTDTAFINVDFGFSDHTLRQMVLYDQFNQTTTIRFSTVQKNKPIAPHRFRFIPPPGTEVLQDPDSAT